MGLTNQIKSQSQLARHGVALPPWWTLATIVAGIVAAAALILSVLAPSAPSAAPPATNPFVAPSTPTTPSVTPTTPSEPSQPDSALSAYIFSKPLQADGRLVQVTGPTGGAQALEANLVTTASAAALAQFSAEVASTLPVTASPVTPKGSASALSVSKVVFTGMSSGAYVFTVTVSVDGNSEQVPVAVSDTATGYKVVT